MRKFFSLTNTRYYTTYKVSALAGVNTIFDLEPLILDDGDDDLELKIQSDDKGKEGDVRDVLIIRRGIEWEIGLSVIKHHQHEL